MSDTSETERTDECDTTNLPLNTSYAGAGLVFVDSLHPLVPEQSADPSLALHATGIRMAATPATHYRAYRSEPVSLPDTTPWVQIELGKSIIIDEVRLLPASERMFPGPGSVLCR
jgi:hypothetical protein